MDDELGTTELIWLFISIEELLYMYMHNWAMSAIIQSLIMPVANVLVKTVLDYQLTGSKKKTDSP